VTSLFGITRLVSRGKRGKHDQFAADCVQLLFCRVFFFLSGFKDVVNLLYSGDSSVDILEMSLISSLVIFGAAK